MIAKKKVVKKSSKKQDIRIVIAQRGWVFVGRYSATSTEVRLDNARCIRRWGTTKGLGELAANGPQPNTALDPHGVVRCHPLAVIAMIDCEVSKWSALLA